MGGGDPPSEPQRKTVRKEASIKCRRTEGGFPPLRIFRYSGEVYYLSDKRVETNVLDYLRWRGDLTLERDPFNEVDALLMCIVSYIDFARLEELRSKNPACALPLGAVCARLAGEDGQRGLSDRPHIPVLEAMAASARFREARIFGWESLHDEEKEMQFDAVSFLLPDETVFIAYMGTDRSLVGWKEDFNMSYLPSVPAQQRATAYAAEIAAACGGRPLRLGGHSKGGNLTVWAASHLPEAVQARILSAWNNDGPGFSEDLFASEGYGRVADRVRTFVPESSVIGILMEHTDDYEVIASTNRSVMQHEPLSWCVEGCRFVRLPRRSALGRLSDEALRDWFRGMTPEERAAFSEALFDVVSHGGKVHSLDELPSGALAGWAQLIRDVAEADGESRAVLLGRFAQLGREIREGLLQSAEAGLEAARRGLRALLPERKAPPEDRD